MLKSLCLIFLLVGCTHTKVPTKTYSNPDWQEPYFNPKFTRINIFSTANAIANEEAKKVGKNYYKAGGPAVLSSYLTILKSQYKNNLLLINSGQFTQPFKNRRYLPHAKQMKQFYHYLDYDAVGLTLENFFIVFDDQFKQYRNNNIPLVNSNLLQLANGNKKSDIYPWKIKTIDNINVGIINVTTNESKKVLPHLYKGLLVQDPVYSLLKIKKRLAKKNVNIIILLTNFETKCEHPENFQKKFFNVSSQYQLICPADDALHSFLKRLPQNIVALIVNQGTRIITGFFNQTPIVQLPNNNTFISGIELFVDKKSKKINLELSSIKPFVKLCHSFFTDTQDCFLNSVLGKNGHSRPNIPYTLSKAKFLGTEIIPDKNISNILKDK